MGDRRTLCDAMLSWFSRHQRPLPWRRTYHPYHIWISEIMGQQTQMDRVVGYFNKWCARFPNIDSIAKASQEEIYKLWEGLGYYSRARNIQRTAEILCRVHNCTLPDRYDALLALPGIGPYTAAAIMSLAFNRDYPVIDANVERVFARLFDIPTPVKEAQNRLFIEKKSKGLLPSGQARNFNQALMELGALVCLPKAPLCGKCPIAHHCEALQQGTVYDRPVLRRPAKSVSIVMATGLLIHSGKIFIQKRLADDVHRRSARLPQRLSEIAMGDVADVVAELDDDWLIEAQLGLTGDPLLLCGLEGKDEVDGVRERTCQQEHDHRGGNHDEQALCDPA